MAIKGSLREASLPDVLQLLSMGKKTGCLSVTHRNNFGYIYFDRGKISYASIVNRRDRLGDMLVKAGIITMEQLQTAIDAQGKHRDKRVGDLLVELGHISREKLHDQVRVQIEEAVYLLFTWNEGTFNFEADVHPERQDLLVSINPESLLLEGARRVDEWSLIEKKIPSFDVVFDADWKKLQSAELPLSPEQQLVLKHLDGKRDMTQIIERTGLVEFDVGKALYGLLTAGLVHRVGRRSRVDLVAVSDGQGDEHRNLGLAFYRTSMYDDALREFQRVLELHPNDGNARFYIGLIHLRQGRYAEAVDVYQEATRRAGAVAAAFYNLAVALERLGRYAEALSALQEALKRGAGKDPRVHTSIGVVSLMMGDVPEAERALAAAKPLWSGKPSVAWFHYAALAPAVLGDVKRARKVLEEGIALHPHAAALHNNLAAVLERSGAYDDALHAAERGLTDDPALAQLHKNIGDLYYRAGRFDEALDAFGRAVQSSPDLGDDVYWKLGDIFFRRREHREAETCWEHALRIDPENAVVRKQLESLKQAR
ncbi:MAG: tetratricopeptide repeat protein [Gemmatimonadaceae bacterium]